MKMNQENYSRMIGNKHASWTRRCVLMSALFVSVFLYSSLSHAFEVVLRPAVMVQGETVLLQDILTVESQQACANATVLATRIARAPRPGKSRQISRALVAMRLKNNDVDIRSCSFGGAKSVSVEREHQIVTKGMIESYVKSVLIDLYGLDAEALRLHVENMTANYSIPLGALAISHDAERVSMKNGYVHMRIELFVDGASQVKKLVSAKVYEERDVVVVVQTIRARAIIQSADVVLQRAFVPFNAQTFATDVDVIGKVANVLIPGGSAIETSDVKDRPSINKGDCIDAVIKKKSMIVTVSLTALESGSVGDTIKLYSKGTRKHFVGTVINASQVEVAL